MSLLQKEIKEIRDLIDDFKTSKISSGDVHTLMKAYGQTEKRTRTILRSITLEAKYGKDIKKELVKEKLLGG